MRITIDDTNEHFNKLKYLVSGLKKRGIVERHNYLIVRDGKATAIITGGGVLKDTFIDNLLDDGVYALVKSTNRKIELDSIDCETAPSNATINSVKDFDVLETINLSEPTIDLIVYHIININDKPVSIQNIINSYTGESLELKIGKYVASITTIDTSATFMLKK